MEEPPIPDPMMQTRWDCANGEGWKRRKKKIKVKDDRVALIVIELPLC